jgi:hypothetical protein
MEVRAMVRAFCTSGNHEDVKCAVHAAAGVLVGVCAVYNITASCFRRDRHLRVNAVVYSLALAWELKQTMHHLNAMGCDSGVELTPAA